MPFPYLDENRDLNESARQEAGGSFIKLTDGTTHFELVGPETAPAIVLVHGFSVPYFIFDPTFDFLTKAGFRVLRYDLFGRGTSDRPQTAYNIHLFVRQLKELLAALNLPRVHLLGLSMGGPITAAFIDENPHSVEKHILIDPAGAKRVRLSLLLEAVKLPIFGELALGLFGSVSLVKGIASDLFDPDLVEHFQARYKIQMQYKGFKQAILSTMRNQMLESFFSTYERVGKLQKNTLLIWGKNDTTVPFENSMEILKAIPHAEFHAIEACGHIPHYEKPEIVNKILMEFLEK
ncbi:MAG TPA: alpha/beta hydrolase [Anaerolineales bacterium]|nr:alpha/beta hydrolase [Anaerolineales bacterium]HMX20533.1 alpha/beta hydrolase [Anaerolineales bacterium]HNA54305.1 alpha/beta hydrolase [Anaerolineales bacterium]HNB86876.1 alpha/beta hydrolase [Anaerolineales bacterium]HND92470.1 alpha/beta hydrolase [Anaerolineales bacterium]